MKKKLVLPKTGFCSVYSRQDGQGIRVTNSPAGYMVELEINGGWGKLLGPCIESSAALDLLKALKAVKFEG